MVYYEEMLTMDVSVLVYFGNISKALLMLAATLCQMHF